MKILGFLYCVYFMTMHEMTNCVIFIASEQGNIITGSDSDIFIHPHQQPRVKIAAVFL